MTVQLQKNKRYSAKVKLSFLESLAPNDVVANEFRQLGFSGVVVSGSGKNREALGTWIGEDQNFTLPKDKANKISDIKMI